MGRLFDSVYFCNTTDIVWMLKELNMNSTSINFYTISLRGGILFSCRLKSSYKKGKRKNTNYTKRLE